MAEILIHDLHNLAGEAIKTMTNSRSYQILAERVVRDKYAYNSTQVLNFCFALDHRKSLAKSWKW